METPQQVHGARRRISAVFDSILAPRLVQQTTALFIKHGAYNMLLGKPYIDASLFGRLAFIPCCVVLFPRAVVTAWRARRATAMRLFAPLVFLLFALFIQLALDANNRV